MEHEIERQYDADIVPDHRTIVPDEEEAEPVGKALHLALFEVQTFTLSAVVVTERMRSQIQAADISLLHRVRCIRSFAVYAYL